MGATTGIGSRRWLRAALLGIVGATTALGASGPARADTLAIVSDGAAYQATLDGPDAFQLVHDGAAAVAYDTGGRLWVAAPGADEWDSCSVAPADDATPPFSGSYLIRQMLRVTTIGSVDCELTSDPRGGVLVGGSNHTLGSTSTWRLNTATGAMKLATWGYDAAASPDGRRLAVIRHVYRRRGGADERLALGRLGRPSTVHPAHWARSGWSSPSFAPDGRLAAVQWTPRGERLLVGAGRPPFRVAWAPGRAIAIGATAWSSAGDLLVLAGRASGSAYALYRLRGARLPLERIGDDITAFALGPDQTSPAVVPAD
jgi:hypothetical protein